MAKNTVNIKLSGRVFDNFGSPLSEYIKVNYVVEKSKGVPITFDFSEVTFTNPFIVGGVASLIYKLKQNKQDYKIIYNPNADGLHSYLDTIFFPEGINYGSSDYEGIMSTFYEKTYIPLVFFPTGLSSKESKIREGVLGAVYEILKNQLNLSGNILNAIDYWIAELSQNIVDHSGEKHGMIFAQFYPTKNFMDICIVDTGKGLYQSYMESDKHNPTSNKEAVNFAVFGKSTKDIPESRGYGISTSRKMLVEGLNGKFFLYSGDTFFIQTSEREEIVSIETPHKGCYVALRVPIMSNKQFNFYNYVE